MTRTQGAGFTLVEIMMVVVILGILAGVATPAYVRYVRRTKTVEGINNLARIMNGQRTYFQSTTERFNAATYLNAGPTPAGPNRGRYPANQAQWAVGNWAELDFGLDGAHYYQYATTGTSQAFTAQSVGDLDGDGVLATFQRHVVLIANDEQASGLEITNELE